MQQGVKKLKIVDCEKQGQVGGKLIIRLTWRHLATIQCLFPLVKEYTLSHMTIRLQLK